MKAGLRFGRAIFLSILLTFSGNLFGEERDIFDLSLEELMNIKITGMSKQEDKFLKVPAAAFVISQKDIQSNTATSVPELLKIVPGLDVARVSGGRYAVSERGFGALFSNKLLVLIDGKDGYSNLFSNVNWDALDIPFNNIERIEVFRGPAGTIYGSNAVNGIINIVTKTPEKSSRAYIASRVGDLERISTDVIQSGAIGENFDYRLSGRYRNQGRYDFAIDNTDTDTGYENYYAALRVDGDFSDASSSSTNLRYSTTRLGDNYALVAPFEPGGFIFESKLKRQNNFYVSQELSHQPDQDLELKAFMHYDREERAAGNSRNLVHAVNAEGRAHYEVTDSVSLIGGANYRYISADLNDEDRLINASFDDKDPSLTIAALFGQLDYAPSSQIKVSAGIRSEYNEFTDFEYMPNLRIGYYPGERHTLWASAGRATRLPSIIDENSRGVRFLGQTDPASGLPIASTFSASSSSEAETLTAYEAGYRGALHEDLTFDLSGFYYDYSDVQDVGFTGVPGLVPNNPPYIGIPTTFVYTGEAEAWGAELGVRYDFSENYSLYASYSYVDFSLDASISGANIEGANAENKVKAHFHAQPANRILVDLFYFFYDRLNYFPNVDKYHQFDLKTSYLLSEDIKLAFVIRNIGGRQQEFGNDQVLNLSAGTVPRSYYAMLEVEL